MLDPELYRRRLLVHGPAAALEGQGQCAAVGPRGAGIGDRLRRLAAEPVRFAPEPILVDDLPEQVTGFHHLSDAVVGAGDHAAGRGDDRFGPFQALAHPVAVPPQLCPLPPDTPHAPVPDPPTG